jgi:fumarate reductase subunit D
MGLLGDFTKAILIYTCVFWVLAIMGCIATGQMAIALLLLVGIIIPLSIIAHEYWKIKRRSKLDH